MMDKDHLDLMRNLGQLETGQVELGRRVGELEKQMREEFARLREDFRAVLADAVGEMRRVHADRDAEAREHEKRISKLENDNSQHNGAWSVGSKALVAVGAIGYIVFNGFVAWIVAVVTHAGK